MCSSYFAHGPRLDEVYTNRDFALVTAAFAADRVRLSTGELAPALGHVVPGALVQATEAGLARLTADAGDGSHVVTLTADGGAHRAHAWFVGAAGDASVGAVANDDVIPMGVFVYGTLRSGEERHSIMQRGGLRRALEATVRGSLFDLGEYPGFVPAASRADTVVGELYEYEDPRTLLRELDEVEDFFGYDSDASLYRRSLLDVPTPGGPILAWVYVYVGDVSGARRLPGGDWKRR